MVLASLFAAASIALTPSNAEIVVAPDAPPSVKFAARELRTFLSRVFAADVQEVKSATPGRCSIHLGECAALSNAGLSTKSLARDAFVLAARDGKVFVAGRDDPKIDPAARIRRSCSTRTGAACRPRTPGATGRFPSSCATRSTISAS